MFYVTVILFANVLIILANVFRGGEFLPTLLFSVLGTVSVIAVDGIFAFAIRRLPEKWFAPESKLFKVSRKEKRLYSKLRIKAITPYVPELGGFTGFHKDKLKSNNDSEYLGRFLLESNYGVAIHIADAVFGFLIGLFPFCGGWSVWVPVALVNFVLSMLPVFVLRNNTPPLMFLYKKSLKK